MAGRPRLPIGTFGEIRTTEVGPGRFRSMTRFRDWDGQTRQVPRAIGPMDAAMRRALLERSDLIEARASAILDEALAAGEAWTRALRTAPVGSSAADWRRHACTVAAYRDRYGIVGEWALGPAPQSMAQRLDAVRARAALEAAQRLAEERHAQDAPRPTVTAGLPPAGIQF